MVSFLAFVQTGEGILGKNPDGIKNYYKLAERRVLYHTLLILSRI
jgi:hypothetical protein